MRNIFLLIAFTIMPMLVTAQTYFKDGTTWKTRLCGTLSAYNTVYYNTYAKLNGTETVDGHQALKLFYYEETKPEPNYMPTYVPMAIKCTSSLLTQQKTHGI